MRSLKRMNGRKVKKLRELNIDRRTAIVHYWMKSLLLFEEDRKVLRVVVG